jgi:hypothetical protein
MGAAACALSGAFVSPAQASTSVHFSASFAEFSCGVDRCGTGVVAQFGKASFVLNFGDPLCTAELPALVTVTFTDGSTLMWCQIGIDRVAVPGGLIEPFTGPFNVIGGTGVFAGATGSGVQNAIWVNDANTGDTRVAHRAYSGTLTVP